MDEMKITLTVEQARQMRKNLADVYVDVVSLLTKYNTDEKLEAFRSALNKIDNIAAELHSALLEGE